MSGNGRIMPVNGAPSQQLLVQATYDDLHQIFQQACGIFAQRPDLTPEQALDATQEIFALNAVRFRRVDQRAAEIGKQDEALSVAHRNVGLDISPSATPPS